MAVTFTVPGPVRSIRSFDRRAGWTFIHAGCELALLGADLDPLGSWRLPVGVVGLADADPITDTVIYDAGPEIVLQRHGTTRWRMPHAGWGPDHSGGSWLGGGYAWAVLPSDDGSTAELVRMNLSTGAVTGTASLGSVPLGIELVQGPDGWLGIGLGDDRGARAWFLRMDGAAIELREAPWRNRVLTDVHASGKFLLTTPQGGSGPLQVLSWPELEPVWSIEAPSMPDSSWLECAVFVGDDLVAAYDPGDSDVGECVRIPPNRKMAKVGGESWPAPGGTGFWIEYDGERLIRR
ncbi:MAG: hypothetical protein ACOH16_01445 [Propionibacteriaceae bacterium]